MPRRTHAELEAENLVLYRELEAVHERLGSLFADDDTPDDDEMDDDGDDEGSDAGDQD